MIRTRAVLAGTVSDAEHSSPQPTSATNNVKAGDRLQVRHGPFLADALVVEITDRGAIIDYTGKVTLVGYTSVVPAPDGTQLAGTPTQGFIGRAHLATRPVPGIYVWNGR